MWLFHEDAIHFDLIVPRTKNYRKYQDAYNETNVQEECEEKKKAERAGPGYMRWQMKNNAENS